MTRYYNVVNNVLILFNNVESRLYVPECGCFLRFSVAYSGRKRMLLFVTSQIKDFLDERGCYCL